jgi:phospholipase/carboxylesterase
MTENVGRSDRRARTMRRRPGVTGDPGPGTERTTRRGFLARAVAGVGALAATACRTHADEETATMPRTDTGAGARRPAEGRLHARPGTPTQRAVVGQHALQLARGRDALLYVPAGYDGSRPAPLAVMLHGAGGDAGHGLWLLQALADAAGLVLLAPPSRRETWDVILGRFGPDVAFVDAALEATFARCAIDPARVAVGGFSDGASYALSLGLTNGDLFTHVIAFSPGFMAPAAQVGQPRCYVSHGTRDAVLPIDRCSRRLVPTLQRAGYDVRYREFDGPHTVPADVARESVAWFTPGAAGG